MIQAIGLMMAGYIFARLLEVCCSAVRNCRYRFTSTSVVLPSLIRARRYLLVTMRPGNRPFLLVPTAKNMWDDKRDENCYHAVSL
jgi:hypothetical protein